MSRRESGYIRQFLTAVLGLWCYAHIVVQCVEDIDHVGYLKSQARPYDAGHVLSLTNRFDSPQQPAPAAIAGQCSQLHCVRAVVLPQALAKLGGGAQGSGGHMG